MSQVKPTYEELQGRLAEAERILDALRTGKVDALLGESSPVLLRTLELQRALEESEERFRLISALITDYAYSFLVNPDGSLKGEWVSDSFVKVFGFNIEEIDARGGWPSMVYPEDLSTMFEHAQRVVGGKGDTVEARFVTRTGEIRWIRDHAVPIWDKEKRRVVRVYGSAKDITDQRLAQEALEERDLQIADFMARTEDMIYTHDLDGNILSVNQATSRNLGIPTDELLSMKIQDVLDPSVRDQFSQYLARLLQDGQANGLMLVITRGGEKRLWEYKNYLRFAKDGTAVAGGMARDVTDTWEAKEALQQAKETLEAIIETAGALIVMVDQDGKIAHFNRACEELTGYRREEVLGKPLLDLLVPEGWREIVQARYANPHDPSLREPHANPWRTRSGEERMIEWRCTPLAGGLLGGVSMVGVGVDVTERVKLEQELTDTSHLLQHVLSTSPIVMYTLRPYDGARRTTWVTSNVEEITGYTVDEALRPGWWEEHLHPQDREEALHTVSGLWSRRTLTYSYRFRRKDGTYMWVRDDIRVLRDETGRAVEAIGAWVDVTEQRMAEEERKLLETQLNQAQKMEAIGRLAGGVAHDFNNMLTVISGYGEIALQKLSSLDPVYEDIKEMLSAAEKSSELTRQLLAFSRKQIIAPRRLDLNEHIRAMEKFLRRLLGEDLSIELFLGEGLWEVYMDPSQVDQILANLVVNSRDAMPRGGTLTIETANLMLDEDYCRFHPGASPGEHVLLAVTDTGCGMDRETLQRAFEPFFTTKGEGKGTGLGLSTVYGIVKQNNGTVQIYSEPDRGTTVKVYLPRLSAARTETWHAEESISQEEPRARETVLLVEDEDTVRKLTKAMLENLGYTVLSARGPGEAIAMCEKYRGGIHLLLTDVVMPLMDGRELSERVKTLKPGVKVLFMSGYTSNAISHHGVLEPGVQFIQKPFTRQDLALKVRRALEGK